jgi:hypothetical protein
MTVVPENMMLRRALCIALISQLIVSLGPVDAVAQSPPQPVRTASFSALNERGNNIPELQTAITEGFSGTATTAITVIALKARLNVTYEANIVSLNTKISIRAHNRTAAKALLEVAEAAGLVMNVSARGQVVVENAPQTSSATIARRPTIASDSVRDSLESPVALKGIEVQAERPELGQFRFNPSATLTTASSKALRMVPMFVEPDVLRSVQAFPGIQARSDWTAGFNVRGGESDQAGVLLDGFPIYNPFHVGGLFSAFIDQMVDGVDVHAGALPARFGDRLSGMLDVRSAVPTSASLSGTVSVSFAATSGTIGRAFKDGNGGWQVGARRTYLDAVLRAFDENGFPFHFEDASARLTRRVWKDIDFGMTAYGSRDVLEERYGENNAGISNAMLGVSLGKTFATRRRLAGFSFDSLTVNQRSSITTFDVGLEFPQWNSTVDNSVREWRIAGAGTVHRPQSSTTLGYQVSPQRLEYSASTPVKDFNAIIPFDSLAQIATNSAVFVEHLWRPRDALLMNIGGRFEHSTSETGLGFSPRASVKYFLTPRFAISAGGGRTTQVQHSLGREEEVLQPVQLWVLADSNHPASSVRDASVRAERWLGASRFLQVGGYYKKYDGLLLANRFSDTQLRNDAFTVHSGASYGAEFMLRQLESERVSGWASYTYALGYRTGVRGNSYPAAQDRRHSLSLVGNLRTSRYSLSARANFATGLPHTEVLGELSKGQYDPTTQRWLIDEDGTEIRGVQGARRLPPYHRIDVSATRNGRLFGGEAQTFLSIVNVFNFKNPAGYLYEFGRNSSRRGEFPNLPFVPTIGMKIVY